MKSRIMNLLNISTIVLLLMLVGMSVVQVVQDTRRYGFSYEVITIIDGDWRFTQMNVGITIGFIGFLSLILFLLSYPYMVNIKEIKKEE